MLINSSKHQIENNNLLADMYLYKHVSVVCVFVKRAGRSSFKMIGNRSMFIACLHYHRKLVSVSGKYANKATAIEVHEILLNYWYVNFIIV